jgi:GTPase SAR1 family protein
MEGIAKDIVNKFKNDPSPDFKAFITEAIQPVMYMLKRQQNLADFFDPLKTELIESIEMPCVSQRLLIDTIMINSDRFLCRLLISLLSKRNPVPMIQPPTTLTKNQYRSILSIIHIWDCQRPILLSFGIGQYKGKTSLVNALFESNFEESMEDPYFCATVDVDFGFHFVERRPVNIADAHGEISIDTLNQISMLFNGFLVHIEWTYLCSNQANVIKYLTSLPSQAYIQLIIRDVRSENDSKLKSSADAIRSTCPSCQIFYLLNVADKSSLQNRTKIKKLRESIFHDAAKLRCFDEKSIQERLEKLLDNTEKQIIEQDKVFIERIRHVLVKGKIEDYPLYSLFMNMCKKRLEVAKIDPYGRDFQSDKLYQLNDELFKADSEFKNKQMDPNSYGAGFNYFFELLDNQESRFAHLHLLSMELTREREKQAKKHEDLPFYERLSLEIHWRNVIISSTLLPHAKQQMLINAYRDYIAEGNPFEIVDGDNFEMQGNFLTKVFQLFPNKKFFVISVIGPQNSGKSTLLNFLFGTSFEARDGRCTKGKIIL